MFTPCAGLTQERHTLLWDQYPSRSSLQSTQSTADTQGYSHEVLVPDLAQLDQVRFKAVHRSVCSPVVPALGLEVPLQTDLAVVDLPVPSIEPPLVTHAYAERGGLHFGSRG